MYTNYNSNLEKNQMMTPPIIGLTSSIVNDKLNNISLEDNSTGLFKIEDSKIKPLVEMPIETNNFIISGTDEEIDSNENNAVNKRYLINKYIGKDATSITVDKVTTKNLTLKHQNGLYSEIYITNFTKPGIGTPFPAICVNYLFSLQDRTLFRTPITLVNSAGGIEFNANQWGEQDSSDYPTTKLVNLVTSEISTDEMNNMTNNNMLDNVCPTYKYCENKYMKSSTTELALNKLYINYNNGKIFRFESTLIDGSTTPMLRLVHNSTSMIYMNWNRVMFNKQIAIPSNSMLSFNTNEIGQASNANYPQGELKNIITSDITAEQITNFTNADLLDNVCPTYQYCENTYAKKSDIPSSPTIDVFTRTNTRSITLFKSGIKTQISGGFIVDELNTDTTKFCDFFSTADENKFYVYNLDINFTMTSTTDGVTDSKMAFLLKTIYLDFNKNSEYFEFYENKTYMINFTVTDATVEGHLTFTAMGNFKPASSRILGICRDFPSSITTDVDGTINLTLTFKRKEI